MVSPEVNALRLVAVWHPANPYRRTSWHDNGETAEWPFLAGGKDIAALDSSVESKHKLQAQEQSRMKTRSINTFLLAVCLGGTVIAQDVKYNFEPGTDFSKYKTYK